MKNILIKESNIGNIYVSFETIQTIVNESVLSVAGVYKKDPNFFTKLLKNNGIKIDPNKNTLIIDIPIKIIYGNNIPNICLEIQKLTSHNLTNFLEIKNIIINVLVEGLIMDDELEKIAAKKEKQYKKEKKIILQ